MTIGELCEVAIEQLRTLATMEFCSLSDRHALFELALIIGNIAATAKHEDTPSQPSQPRERSSEPQEGNHKGEHTMKPHFKDGKLTVELHRPDVVILSKALAIGSALTVMAQDTGPPLVDAITAILTQAGELDTEEPE